MEYAGVPIDLLFVSIPSMSSIDTGEGLNISDRSILRGLDDLSMRSMNGVRVCAELKASVPQLGSFRHALRLIKLWANRMKPFHVQFPCFADVS